MEKEPPEPRAKALPKPRSERGGLVGSVIRLAPAPIEAKLLRMIERLRSDLKHSRDVERASLIAVRRIAQLFRADHWSLAQMNGDLPVLLGNSHGQRDWHSVTLAAARNQRESIPPEVVTGILNRRGRGWAIAAIAWDTHAGSGPVRDAFNRAVAATNEIIESIDQQLLIDARTRIDRRVMEQVRSEDLFYQVLDALRSLTRFDHSGYVLVGSETAGEARIVAEKRAWHRGKGRRVGSSIPVSADEWHALTAGSVVGYRLVEGQWMSWDGGPPAQWLHDLARPPAGATPTHEPMMREALAAPLISRDSSPTVIVVAGQTSELFGEYEASLLLSFIPSVSIALQNSRRTETLQSQLLETERKHAMADLARSVAHDVNNALAAVVPLIEQMQLDASGGRIDPPTLISDLKHIDLSLRACQRIFQGMLRFARTAARPQGAACLRNAASLSLDILGANMARRGIRAVLHSPESPPPVTLSQPEALQVVMNLLSNARDAMPSGGELSISVIPEGDQVRLVVTDEGVGIPEDKRQRVFDPFFTTKAEGSGLGLSICREIVWRRGGRLELTSEVGRGTTIEIRLPIAGEEAHDQLAD